MRPKPTRFAAASTAVIALFLGGVAAVIVGRQRFDVVLGVGRHRRHPVTSLLPGEGCPSVMTPDSDSWVSKAACAERS